LTGKPCSSNLNREVPLVWARTDRLPPGCRGPLRRAWGRPRACGGCLRRSAAPRRPAVPAAAAAVTATAAGMTQEPQAQQATAEEARRAAVLQQLAAHLQAQQDAAHRQQLQCMPADLPPQLQYLLDTYILGRKLGGGSFGTVRPETA